LRRKKKNFIEKENNFQIEELSNILNQDIVTIIGQSDNMMIKIDEIKKRIIAINQRIQKPITLFSDIEMEEDTDSDEEIFSVGEFTLQDSLNDNKRINQAILKLQELKIIDENDTVTQNYFEDVNRLDRAEIQRLFNEDIKLKKLRIKNKDRFKTKGGSNIPLVTDIKEIYEEASAYHEEESDEDIASSDQELDELELIKKK